MKSLILSFVSLYTVVPYLRVQAQLFTRDWLIDNTNWPMPSFNQNTDGTYTFSNGLVSRTFSFAAGLFGTVDIYSFNRGSSLLRAIGPEGYLMLDNYTYSLGTLTSGANFFGYMNRTAVDYVSNPQGWDLSSWSLTTPTAPFPWTPGTRGSPKTAQWPPNGVTLVLTLKAPATAPPSHQAVGVQLIYEMYPGIPLITKWMVVNSTSSAAAGVVVNSTTVEYLRLAPPYSPLSFSPYPPSTLQTDVTSYLYVQTDQAHSTQVVWSDDSTVGNDPGAEEPVMSTSYTSGPGVILSGGSTFIHNNHTHKPRLHRTLVKALNSEQTELRYGGTAAEFVSFRTFLLVTDTSDPERYGLAVRRLYRLWAPHVQENPIFFHAVGSDNASFTQEVDQMAAVGFEMLIYSFGSGFNLETLDPTYINQIKEQIAYAKSNGIEVGGYDLICLQRGDGGYGGNVGYQWDTVVTPPNQYGEDACFASGWVDQLTEYAYTFINQTGLSMVETDGPYGGESCASTNHSMHIALSDSVYQQTRSQADWYARLREFNVYINQPDNYFFEGGQRTGIGYNEDQYNLPRWEDVTVTRTSIYEDTYRKLPTQGWTFVPIVDYHGGGAAAAFEPMSEHLPEYEMALATNLGAGVAACYRGFRLYDTPEVQAVVAKWVNIYKTYRDIIISDIIHIRRPDGQSLDAFMHANPFVTSGNVGFALVFNPTLSNITQQIAFPLYYTGISTTAKFSQEGNTPVAYTLNRDYSVKFNVTLPAQTVTWYVITSGDTDYRKPEVTLVSV